jgi:NAD(P)-dependent dehydrogenase (short-subunit alcohol dehydrogenase family)
MDRFSLDGKTALVTGASRGIGAATARALDDAGARVALVARGEEGLRAIAGELRHDPVIVAADLGEREAPRAVASQVLDALGRVDVLVNNAAAAARLATVDTDAAIIDESLAVNVRAPLLLVAALLPSMIERAAGLIVNLSSASGLIGTPLRRWATPEDIADVIVFLASDAARFITGETISVDGEMAHALDVYGAPV